MNEEYTEEEYQERYKLFKIKRLYKFLEKYLHEEIRINKFLLSSNNHPSKSYIYKERIELSCRILRINISSRKQLMIKNF